MDLGLLPSAGKRAMRKAVRRQTQMSDDEFYSRFYGDSRIRRDTVVRVRRLLHERIDPIAERLMPTDYLPMLWDDLDFTHLFFILGQEFGIKLHHASFSGTLDSLIRLVDELIQTAAEPAAETTAQMSPTHSCARARQLFAG